MKIMAKYSGKRKRIILEVDEESLVQIIKKQVQVHFLLPIISFRLYAAVLPGFKVLLNESFPLSFYNLTPSSIIEIDAYGYKSLKLKKKSYNSLYLPTLGISFKYTTLSDEVFDNAVDYCKTGNYFGLFELVLREKQVNPEEDLLNRVHPNLWSPLHYACFHGHGKIVKYLIDNHVNVNRVTVDEWTALQLACFAGNLESVTYLMQSKNLQINKITKFRGTGLHLACEKQFTDIVKVLLMHHACVTTHDPSGKDPFEVNQDIEIAELLAKEAGEQQRLKYDNVEVTPFLNQVWQTEPFYIHDRYILLDLDDNSGYLSKYRSIDDYHDKNPPEGSIRLGDIQNVCEYNSRYIGKKDCFYFEVQTAKTTWRFYHNKKEMVKEWIERIQVAANYFCAHEENYLNKKDSLKRSVVDSPEDKPCVVESAPVDEAVAEKCETVNSESFELLEELGEGGFGVVYMVRKKDTGEIFAMKVQNKKKLSKSGKLIYAVRECKIMKDLNHPFLIALYYAFQNKNSLYLVIDYCSNGDLAGLIKKYGKLEEKVARFYLAEIILALEYLHTKGIVYRDLKPSNILIDSAGHIKLTDFGLAKENVNALNPAMSMAGTIAYLAPETLNRKGTTPASDIYALGPMLYEMLTGEPIFAGEDTLSIINSMQKLKVNYPEYVSIGARQFINWVMEKVPEKRPKMHQLKRSPFFSRITFFNLAEKRIASPAFIHHHNLSMAGIEKVSRLSVFE